MELSMQTYTSVEFWLGAHISEYRRWIFSANGITEKREKKRREAMREIKAKRGRHI